MAFRKTLAQRLFNITKVSTQTLPNCRISSSSVRTRAPPDPDKTSIVTDPGDGGIFRRFLHKRSVALDPELRSLSVGENLMGKLKSIGIARDRIRLDGLSPPPPAVTCTEEGLTVEDARKLLRVAQLEAVKARLREIPKSWIPYSDFVRVCREGCLDPDWPRRSTSPETSSSWGTSCSSDPSRYSFLSPAPLFFFPCLFIETRISFCFFVGFFYLFILTDKIL